MRRNSGRQCPAPTCFHRDAESAPETAAGLCPGRIPPSHTGHIARKMDDMSSTSEPRDLGAFLKARRAQLTPHEVGLPDGDGHRRVAGLRREEVARLASISVDYYTRLEQGRVQASASVLMTLARTLRLDEDQQTYLYEIAGKTDARPPRRRAEQKVRPAVRRLLDQLGSVPAVVLGRRLHILDWNPAATALYTTFSEVPAAERNYVRLLFTHRVFRGMHADWEHDARDAVAALRMEAARHPDDPELARLVGELSVQDADFRAWWAEHRVSSAGSGTKRYRHPVVGDLTLDCDTWNSPDDSGQRLMILTAEPGSPSADALRILFSWQGDDAPAAKTPREPT
jgi:transcriptional regulator with XRE-family HTH domain